eukprot:gb/GECG01014443.1/.p1 GENE.gb/GECG01014443.1/~~gb/GECG01014443.1/.p1  ORF type:complete len:296 (+),score=65.72 gb/GECG01014443.1/:1-888(+)
MADTLYEVEQASPELANLIRRLKALNAVLGGEDTQDPKNMPDEKTFDGKRTLLLMHMHNIEQLCDARDNSGLSKESRDYIRMKYRIEKERKKLTEEFDALSKQFQEDVKKRKNKLGTAELSRRKKDIQELARELSTLNEKILGRRQDVEAPGGGGDGSGGGAAGSAGSNLQDLMSGNLPQRRVVQEEMSQEQEMKLQGIQREQQEQDDLLDQISESLDQLKETTLDINDELDKQAVMLDEAEQKVDSAQDKMDKVNDRMNEALKIANSKSTQFCVYIICAVVLLGVLGVLFSLIQ